MSCVCDRAVNIQANPWTFFDSAQTRTNQIEILDFTRDIIDLTITYGLMIN